MLSGLQRALPSEAERYAYGVAASIAMDHPELFYRNPSNLEKARERVREGHQRGDVFGYWFDFGDDWRHQIDVVAVETGTGSAKRPRIVKRVGKSPPQYI